MNISLRNPPTRDRALTTQTFTNTQEVEGREEGEGEGGEKREVEEGSREKEKGEVRDVGSSHVFIPTKSQKNSRKTCSHRVREVKTVKICNYKGYEWSPRKSSMQMHEISSNLI